jgi:hypothetical protein
MQRDPYGRPPSLWKRLGFYSDVFGAPLCIAGGLIIVWVKWGNQVGVIIGLAIMAAGGSMAWNAMIAMNGRLKRAENTAERYVSAFISVPVAVGGLLLMIGSGGTVWKLLLGGFMLVGGTLVAIDLLSRILWNKPLIDDDRDRR